MVLSFLQYWLLSFLQFCNFDLRRMFFFTSGLPGKARQEGMDRSLSHFYCIFIFLRHFRPLSSHFALLCQCIYFYSKILHFSKGVRSTSKIVQHVVIYFLCGFFARRAVPLRASVSNRGKFLIPSAGLIKGPLKAVNEPGRPLFIIITRTRANPDTVFALHYNPVQWSWNTFLSYNTFLQSAVHIPWTCKYFHFSW